MAGLLNLQLDDLFAVLAIVRPDNPYLTMVDLADLADIGVDIFHPPDDDYILPRYAPRTCREAGPC